MKPYYFLTLCVLFIASGIVLAGDPIKECYTCPAEAANCADPVDIGKLVKQDCSKAGASAGNATAEGEGETTAAARLVERAEAPAGMICLKASGKVNDTDVVMRGCGLAGCATFKATLGPDAQCVECDTELCNSSIRIKPIEWVFTFIALLCAGVEY